MVGRREWDNSEPIDILHVDDESEMLDLSQLFLEREDDRFRVTTADSATTALEMLDESYDAVVSDYRMPGMDGLEFLETVREKRALDLPFIVFTGQGREEVAMDALNLGADRYLQKRGDATAQYGVLARAISQEVGHYRARQAHRASEKRYQSLFENNPLVIWEEDYSTVKAELDALDAEVDDVEAYFDANPAEIDRLLEEIEVIDVNRNALEYYSADSKDELMSSLSDLFTEASYAATKSLLVQIADGVQHFREQTVAQTLEGESRRELMQVYVPDEYADDYSRVYVTSIDVTEQTRVENALDTLHDVATDLEGIEVAEEVYDVLVTAAVDILQVDLCVVFERQDGDLRGVRTGGSMAAPDEVDPRGDALARETVERDETVLVADSREDDRVTLPSGIHSVASTPLGDHGVLQVAVAGDGELTDRTVDLVEHLAAHGGGTLSRIARERRLRRSDARLQALSRAFPDYAFQLDAQGRYLDVLLGWADDDGRLNARTELVGETVRGVLNPEAAATIQAGIDRALETGAVQTVEYEVEYPDGALRYEGQIAPLPGDQSRVILSAREITDRHATEQELRETNARLAELSSALSHDLRNLVSLVDGHLALVAGEVEHDSLATARGTLERMDALLEETITLASQRDVEPEREPIELARVANEAWTPFSSEPASVCIDCPGTVSGDETRLRRLFENLFVNAVEHAGPDATVRVGRRGDGFYVADDGPGIPEAERDTVFEYGHTTSDDGTGFGLAIVREVATAHGWTVTATDSEDGGACFAFTDVEFADEPRAGGQNRGADPGREEVEVDGQ
jgi:signal transduction histidine kinase/DNA-binding response OmpR family regulator